MTGYRSVPVRCERGLATLLAVLVAASALVGVATAAAAPVRGIGANAHMSRALFEGSPSKKGGGVTSLDWAGYADTGATFTTVSGSWTQPGVSCTGKVAQSAYWVGIDGYASTDPTVQQIGTDSDCTKGSHKFPGGPSYYAWFEMYPASLVVLSPSTYPVSPGDALSATVTLVGSSYQLALSDAGHWSFSTTQSVASAPQNASAEWIVEAPTICTGRSCKPVALSNFGTVGFTGATANGVPVNSPGFSSNQITMTKTKKGKVVKAATSSLGSGGNSFSVTWVSS